MTCRLALVVVSMAALLYGCTGEYLEEAPVRPTLGADFGNAVQHNASLQIDDPAPPAFGNGTPALDGVRAASAMERYRNGTMPPLEIEDTTDIGN